MTVCDVKVVNVICILHVAIQSDPGRAHHDCRYVQQSHDDIREA